MASEFQRRKVAGVFDAMDSDRRGYLVAGDFEALAARWTAVRGVLPGSGRAERLRALMLGWWASLSAAAIDPEHVVIEDVLAVVDVLPRMSGAVTATADALFEAVDENGDDRISQPEYRRLIETWNGRPTDTDEVFARLDLDADGHLSRAEFRQLWTQFWVGDDPREPGTWVFGAAEPLSGVEVS
jgi:hypothetical protein